MCRLQTLLSFLQGNAARNLQAYIIFLTLFNFQQLKDKYSIAYIKLSNYISPLYMAYSYEAKQGPQHIQLAQELTDTSFYLNSTVTTLRHEASELAVA